MLQLKGTERKTKGFQVRPPTWAIFEKVSGTAWGFITPIPPSFSITMDGVARIYFLFYNLDSLNHATIMTEAFLPLSNSLRGEKHFIWIWFAARIEPGPLALVASALVHYSTGSVWGKLRLAKKANSMFRWVTSALAMGAVHVRSKLSNLGALKWNLTLSLFASERQLSHF